MPFSNKEKEKEHQRKYHLLTWNRRRTKHQNLKRIRRTELSKWLKEYKQNICCSKCSENHPACLDLHHLNPL